MLNFNSVRFGTTGVKSQETTEASNKPSAAGHNEAVPQPIKDARQLLGDKIVDLRKEFKEIKDPALRQELQNQLKDSEAHVDEAMQSVDKLLAREQAAAKSKAAPPKPAEYETVAKQCISASRELVNLGNRVDTMPELQPQTKQRILFAVGAALLLLAVGALAVLAWPAISSAAKAVAAAGTVATAAGIAGAAATGLTVTSLAGLLASGAMKKDKIAGPLGELVAKGMGLFERAEPEKIEEFAKAFSRDLMLSDETTITTWLGCLASVDGDRAYPVLKAAIMEGKDSAHTELLRETVKNSQLGGPEKKQLLEILDAEWTDNAVYVEPEGGANSEVSLADNRSRGPNTTGKRSVSEINSQFATLIQEIETNDTLENAGGALQALESPLTACAGSTMPAHNKAAIALVRTESR